MRELADATRVGAWMIGQLLEGTCDLNTSSGGASRALRTGAAYRWMAHQLRGFEKAEAITIWERFLNRGGHVRLEEDEVVLEVEPFSRAPVLLESPLLQPSTPIPWLGDRRVRVELRRA